MATQDGGAYLAEIVAVGFAPQLVGRAPVDLRCHRLLDLLLRTVQAVQRQLQLVVLVNARLLQHGRVNHDGLFRLTNHISRGSLHELRLAHLLLV